VKTSPRPTHIVHDPNDPVRVAFVGGWGRSGSTLLDRLLGQVDGFVSVGELRQLWRRGLVEGASCGCGDPVLGCAFWSEVGERAYGGWGRIDLEAIEALRASVDRGSTTPLLAAPRRPGTLEADLRRYEEVLRPLYRAIRDVAGADVVVDSSKLPSHGMILRQMPTVDLRVVHLIRDPRGVAYSWQKQVVKDPSTGEAMRRYRPWAAAVRYDLYNGATAGFARLGVPYLRVRYEDLVSEVEPTVRRIVAHVRPEATADLAFLETPQVDLGTHHTVGGNPMRFSRGATAITADERWRDELPVDDRRWVEVLTFPWLARYGYTGTTDRKEEASR
jgi:hypothetical protein